MLIGSSFRLLTNIPHFTNKSTTGDHIKRLLGIRVIHYEMHNPTKCIIFNLIISPLLPASTMTTSTKAYQMQLALAELKQQEKPNVSAILKKYQFVQSTLYRRWKKETIFYIKTNSEFK